MFKPILTLLCCLFLSCFSRAQDILQFKVSKPYCLLNFVQAAAGDNGTSRTLQQYIHGHIQQSDTTFYNLIRRYKQLQLDYNYERQEYPQSRRRNRSTADLIIIAAVQADDLAAFGNRMIGILPNSTHHELLSLLGAAAPYYNRLIWDSCKEKAAAQAAILQQYRSQSGRIFTALKTFYNSSWTQDIPFTVAIYPVPGKNGNSTATPHANSLCVGVLADETAHDERMAVVFHEICHVLYDEQENDFQHRLERYFQNNPSPYNVLAGNYFDEGLATACGNGWVYRQLTGKEDTTEWYNDAYINGYGKALYPLVTAYLQQGKAIDSSFIDKAIQAFGKTFPQSLNEYAILLNNMYLYSDADGETERRDDNNMLRKYFLVSSLNASSPIADEHSLDYLKNSSGPQLVIIDRDHKKNIALMETIFPELKHYLKKQTSRDFVVSFRDSKKRPVIIVCSTTKDGLDKAFHKMQQQKYIDEQQPLFMID